MLGRAGHTFPTRQHELGHTGSEDRTDQGYLSPEMSTVDHENMSKETRTLAQIYIYIRVGMRG